MTSDEMTNKIYGCPNWFCMAKRRDQITLGLNRGRRQRVLALISQHPLLKHAESLPSAISTLVDWAEERLWSQVPEPNIQKMIIHKLGEPGNPWSEETDPFSLFAKIAMLPAEEIEAILQGRRPNDHQASSLAKVLGRSEDELRDLITTQYEVHACQDRAGVEPSMTSTDFDDVDRNSITDALLKLKREQRLTRAEVALLETILQKQPGELAQLSNGNGHESERFRD